MEGVKHEPPIFSFPYNPYATTSKNTVPNNETHMGSPMETTHDTKNGGMVNMEQQQTNLIELYDSLNKNEKAAICFGVFPMKLMNLKLTNEQLARLIEIAQQDHKVRF